MIWRLGFWAAYAATAAVLLLSLFGPWPAVGASSGCGDVLDLAAWRTEDSGWAWQPLGRADDGSTAFVLRRATGLWEVVTVSDNIACMVLAGGPARD